MHVGHTTIREVHRSIAGKMLSYVAAGLGLVAALAWNDAIKSVIEYVLPNTGATVLAKIGYAFVTTIVIGIVLFLLEKSTTHSDSA